MLSNYSAMFNKLFYFSNSYWHPSTILIACSPLSLYLFLCFAFLLLVDDCFLLYQKEWDPKHGLPHVILPLCQQVILPTPSHSLLQSQVKRFSVLKLSCLHCPQRLVSFLSPLASSSLGNALFLTCSGPYFFKTNKPKTISAFHLTLCSYPFKILCNLSQFPET